MKKLIFIIALMISVGVLANGQAEAGSIEHGEIPLSEIGWQAANLGILLVVIFFVLKKTVKDVFLNRQKQFVDQSEKTKRSLKEAEQALSGIKAKLNTLESGEQNALEKAAVEAEALGLSLIKDTEAQALKIKKDAEFTLAAELEKVKSEIRAAILNQAISVTTQKLSDQKNQPKNDSEASFLKQVAQVKI